MLEPATLIRVSMQNLFASTARKQDMRPEAVLMSTRVLLLAPSADLLTILPPSVPLSLCAINVASQAIK